jgi:protein involved in sex pheromone biosynthesis
MSCLPSAIKLSILSIASSILLLSGCASTVTSGNEQSKSLSDLNYDLNNMVSNNSCTASFQCKVLEVGARACGGPSKYAVYSTLNTSQEEAEQLAQQITNQENIQNKAQGLTDCSPVLEVQSLCINHQCQSFDIK